MIATAKRIDVVHDVFEPTIDNNFSVDCVVEANTYKPWTYFLSFYRGGAKNFRGGSFEVTQAKLDFWGDPVVKSAKG